ncbi:hypothetical protein F1880_000814 [Penicillium rolfsii]|nr:hypothetical protein F1880_000814 [Penicillium rolfsii]
MPMGMGMGMVATTIPTSSLAAIPITMDNIANNNHISMEIRTRSSSSSSSAHEHPSMCPDTRPYQRTTHPSTNQFNHQ